MADKEVSLVTREWFVVLLSNWPPLPSVVESCSQEPSVRFSSLLPTSCSLGVLPRWMKPSVKKPVLNISEQLDFSVDLKSFEALNVTNPDLFSAHESKCYPWLLGCCDLITNITHLKSPEMSWHDSSSEGFIISFIIYGRDCVQAAAFPLWWGGLRGCWDEENLFIRWRGWPRWLTPVVTARYTVAACHL